MKHFILTGVVCGLFLSLTPLLCSAQDWGTLKGKFVLDGEAPAPKELKCDKDPATCCAQKLIDDTLVIGPNKEIANVFVYLRSKPSKVHPDYDKLAATPLELDNKNCMFTPHASVLWNKRKLLLKNSDNVGHNTNYGSAVQGFNVLIPAEGSVDKTLKASENLPQNVSCNIHPWMSAKLLVRDNPYGVVSAADGTFEIKHLPLDKGAEFVVWHEKSGYVKSVKFASGAVDDKGRFKLDIKAGDTDLGEIKIPVKLLSK
ncbi:MAG: hypothetical protein SFX18_13865 [Pirellulales bacterium]|nr:hypothetical protein [Pirellulales bacterium]